jgi:rod shape-determining protein MreD
LLLLLQSNLYHLFLPFELMGVRPPVTPNLVLPLVIFVGVHEASMTRGAFLAFVLGYAVDLQGSAPIGMFTFVFVALWWLAKIAGIRLTSQTLLTKVTLAFAFAVVEAMFVLVLLAIFGSDPQRPVEIAKRLVPHAVGTALAAPLVFYLAERLHLGTLGSSKTHERKGGATT